MATVFFFADTGIKTLPHYVRKVNGLNIVAGKSFMPKGLERLLCTIFCPNIGHGLLIREATGWEDF